MPGPGLSPAGGAETSRLNEGLATSHPVPNSPGDHAGAQLQHAGVKNREAVDNPSPRRPIAAALALGGGAGAGIYAAASSGTATAPAVSTAAATAQPAAVKTTVANLTQLYDNVTPGVVDITVTSSAPSNGFGPGGGTTQAEGSGFVVDTAGDIVTNQHVVDGATSITVRFKDGKTVKATLVGTDPSTDIAVIKVDVAASGDLHPLTYGDSSTVVPGQEVVAIGSPFGLAETVTSGIVSALHRTMDAPNSYSIGDAIQTDAPINHGNSGGPLLDATGNVIGVNAQIQSDGGGNDGVGFAIPIDAVKSVVEHADRRRQGAARLPRHPRRRRRERRRRPGVVRGERLARLEGRREGRRRHHRHRRQADHEGGRPHRRDRQPRTERQGDAHHHARRQARRDASTSRSERVPPKDRVAPGVSPTRRGGVHFAGECSSAHSSLTVPTVIPRSACRVAGCKTER